MGRGLAFAALLGALALLASCAEEDEAETTSTATRPMPSSTPSPTSATPPTPTPSPTPVFDQYGCEMGPDGEKCRLLATYTPVPTPPVAPPVATYPPGTRTGVAEVDVIIDAVERKDAARLAELVTFLTYPCEGEKPQQPHPLRCREGQQVGDPLVGIWVTHVEGGLWPFEADGDRTKLARMIDGTLTNRALELVSVYKYDGNEPGWSFLEPDYVVTWARWSEQAGPEFDNLIIRDGGIIKIAFAFPEPEPPIWEDPGDGGWILPRAR